MARWASPRIAELRFCQKTPMAVPAACKTQPRNSQALSAGSCYGSHHGAHGRHRRHLLRVPEAPGAATAPGAAVILC